MLACENVRAFCLTSKMSHDYGRRDSCAAGGVTDMVVGSGALLGVLRSTPEALDVCEHIVDNRSLVLLAEVRVPDADKLKLPCMMCLVEGGATSVCHQTGCPLRRGAHVLDKNALHSCVDILTVEKHHGTTSRECKAIQQHPENRDSKIISLRR